MNGSISHLHNRYRTIGNNGYEGIIANRLNHICLEKLPILLASFLDHAFGDNQTVYILRQVNIHLALQVNKNDTDSMIARHWSKPIMQGIVEIITRSGQEGMDWVRFDNQAAFIAQFMIDLLNGRSHRFWFYFPFENYPIENMAATIKQVLLDNQENLPKILALLHQEKMLETALAQVDDDALSALWLPIQTEPLENLRPLFIKTLELVDVLELWQESQPASTDLLFHHYLATNPETADWQDQRSLTTAVFTILRYLIQHYHLDTTPLSDKLADQTLKKLMVKWDWLDVDWLIQAITEQLVSSPSKNNTNLPARPVEWGATPRQKALLESLKSALKNEPPRLDGKQPESTANALRLFSLLAAHDSEWAEEAVTKSLIERLLAVWAALLKSSSPTKSFKYLQKGDIWAAVQLLPASEQSEAVKMFRNVIKLGETAVAIIQQFGMLEESQTIAVPQTAQTNSMIETTSAGIFLLLRPLLDSRLSWLVQQSDYLSDAKPTPYAAFLLALGLRWAGQDGIQRGQIDPGISYFAGLDRSHSWDFVQSQFASITQADNGRFQFELVQMLANHRLFNPDIMFLYQVELDDLGKTLVAGADNGRLWLFGTTEFQDDLADTVQTWRTSWQTATGSSPKIVTKGALYTSLKMLEDVDPMTNEIYDKGQEAVIADLANLSFGGIGLPDHDLTVAITAVALIRLWARWLRQFADSSTSYLLTHLIRRAGRLLIDEKEIIVEIEPRSLDMILEMVGYLDEIERVPWLEPQRVRFSKGQGYR